MVALVLLTAGTLRSTLASQQVGVAAGVVGVVEISSEARQPPVKAKSGLELLLRDRLASNDESHMQAVLLDRTTLTLGPNSVLVIDELVYDPATSAGNLTATFSQGMVQYMSGDIAKSEAENITIVTPVGTLKVSGTSVFIMNDSKSGSIFIGLLGPGRSNDASLVPGGFVLSNELGTTTVLRSGHGVFTDKGAAPGAPMLAPAYLLDQLQAGFTSMPATAGARGAGKGPANAATSAGQNLADTAMIAGEMARVSEMMREIEEVVREGPEVGVGLPDSFFSFR